MSSAALPLPQHPFASEPPRVTLVNTFTEPYNNAVATARTCYSSRVITPADVNKDDAARRLRDSIAQSTYQAGHHTTIGHATFQFVLENVSRQLIWSFLHAHPFYNSEQVSQRYVAVKAERALIPLLHDRAARLYLDTLRAQISCYQDLVALLGPTVGSAYFQIFPGRKKRQEDYAGAVRKRAQEIARYALPVATFAHLYHTISGVTLHRYNRLSNMLDVPVETRFVVQAMVAEVNRIDPLFFQHIEDPIPLEETHEYGLLQGVGVNSQAREFCAAFDAQLAGGMSVLVDYKIQAQATLARAVRSVLGVTTLSDEDAIAAVLSPAQNPYLGNALNLTSLGKLTRTLAHPHYTFAKKLSHTADSQDQRHRLTPGWRPVLHTHYMGGEPDLVIPNALRGEALDRFMLTMRQTWQAIDTLLDDGVAPQDALYLLPNAFPIRFEESGDLLGLHHKWTTRLCYTAQEEIWRACKEEVLQVRAVHPLIGQHIGPPCQMRHEAGVRPVCPEGERFCGVPVWKLKMPDYQRTI